MVEVMGTLHFLLRQDQSILNFHRTACGLLKTRIIINYTGLERDQKTEAIIMLNAMHKFWS